MSSVLKVFFGILLFIAGIFIILVFGIGGFLTMGVLHGIAGSSSALQWVVPLISFVVGIFLISIAVVLFRNR
jgi:hypothetical protein